jgi:hypothetical protein
MQGIVDAFPWVFARIKFQLTMPDGKWFVQLAIGYFGVTQAPPTPALSIPNTNRSSWQSAILVSPRRRRPQHSLSLIRIDLNWQGKFFYPIYDIP